MSSETLHDNESYREHLATVDQKGKRVWIFPKKPQGPWFNRRIWVTIACFVLLFGVPFVKIGGHPLLLFNIFDREFVLVGKPFFPSDFYLFALGLIIFFVFIILFTVVYGRIWCGWACPQTLFMEMIFRPIEYWIDGDANAQRRLAARPWDTDKILRRTAKYGIFLLISTIIAHTVMAYLIGPARVWALITHSPFENTSGFIALTVFTLIFFFVFAYLREQVCTVICPYGRLQGVLMDKDTAQVAYDFKRGEPRGKKGAVTGDCIDCALCVQVCPTGIDIRNGTQLECVNCTACIDACDAVMLKIGRPKELIRIDSLNGINEGKGFHFTRRVKAYTVVLGLLMLAEGALFIRRTDMDVTALRVPGLLFQKQPDGRISNLYNIQIVNKTFDKKHIELKSPMPGAIVKVVGDSLVSPSAGKAEAVVFISFPANALHATKTKVPVEVYASGRKMAEATTTFFAPSN